MVNAKNLAAGLILFAVFIASVEAKLYKWVDRDGVTHYGETIPPEYADRDNVQLNEKGRVIKRNEKPSAEQVRIQKEAEAKKLADEKAAAEQRRKDTMLLSTFSNEDEIDLARDRNLQQVNAIISSIRLLLQSAQNDMDNYQLEAEQRTQAGKPLPDSLQADIEETKSRLVKLQQDLDKSLEKSDAIRASYAADKMRYRELTVGSAEKNSQINTIGK